MKYYCLNPIAEAGLLRLPETYEKAEKIEDADAILVRSAQMLDLEFSEKLQAISRAGAGTNNIPSPRCAEKGIVVFNTPGANANGVKELTILALLLASRDVKGGMNWVDSHKDDEDIAKTMEKAKAEFAGNELKGKTIGVIGLGAIGVLVANVAKHLGMKVIGFDPYLSVTHALLLDPSVHVVKNADEVYESSDYITLHVPETAATKGMINAETLGKMKNHAVLLNLARAGLINEADLADALSAGKIRKYVTDVPDHATMGLPNVIAFPHLGASTEESELNCAVMAADEIVDFLENGNITNSVNYPACSLGPASKPARICVFHKNVPNVISALTSILGSSRTNLSDMVSKSAGDFAYAMFDMDSDIDDAIISAIRGIPDVIRVKVIRK